MKKEWLAANVTAVRSPGRAERAIWGGISAGRFLWLIQAVFVVGEPLCDVGTAYRALISLLRVI